MRFSIFLNYLCVEKKTSFFQPKYNILGTWTLFIQDKNLRFGRKVGKYVDFGIRDINCTPNGGELVYLQEIFTQFRHNNKVTESLQV